MMTGLFSPSYAELRYSIAVAQVAERGRIAYAMKLLRARDRREALAAWDWWARYRYDLVAEVKRREDEERQEQQRWDDAEQSAKSDERWRPTESA